MPEELKCWWCLNQFVEGPHITERSGRPQERHYHRSCFFMVVDLAWALTLFGNALMFRTVYRYNCACGECVWPPVPWPVPTTFQIPA